MANMIEQSLLCKVLDAPDLEILHSNGVVEEMFLTCKDEIHFIVEHYNSYKQMPDKLTFLGRFKDFQMLEVTESTDYLVYKLKEAYTYTKLVPLIEDTAKVVKEDSIKAIQYLKEEIEKLEKSVPVSRNKDGYDIISNAGDRLTEYKKRCEVKGLIGIPTGIPKLDEITNGWLWGEDLVVLTGRNLKVEFSRNVPNNLTEIVDTVTKLDGKVDKETLLSLLPFIDNPKEVLEKLEADKERDRQSTDPYSTQNITEDSNNLFPNLNAQNSPQEALNAQGATIPQPEQ